MDYGTFFHSNTRLCCTYVAIYLVTYSPLYRGYVSIHASSMDAFHTQVVALPAFWRSDRVETDEKVWKWQYTNIPQSIPLFQSIFQFSNQRHLEDNTTTVPSVASSHWRSKLALYVFHPCCFLSGEVRVVVHAPVQSVQCSLWYMLQSNPHPA